MARVSIGTIVETPADIDMAPEACTSVEAVKLHGQLPPGRHADQRRHVPVIDGIEAVQTIQPRRRAPSQFVTLSTCLQ